MKIKMIKMKNLKKVIVFLAIVCIGFSTFFGCSQSADNDKGVTVVDIEGNEIIIEKTPERIIALLASDVEILYALGVQDKLVGVGEYANFPEEVMNKKAIGSGLNTNVEEIIDLEPDVVFIGVMAQTEEQMEQLKQAGIAVVASNAQTIQSTYESIEMMGKVVGKAKEAEKIVEDMKTGFEELKEKSKDKEEINAYIEVSPLQFGLWTCGKGTFVQELVEILNINNIFGELDGWAEVSEEQVIDKNPDIILTAVGVSYGVEKPMEDILVRENWKDIKAITNNKVYMIDSDKSARPGPRLLEAAKEIYEVVHGE